jgi:ATP-binding cassette, subfamily B, bacterial PglK
VTTKSFIRHCRRLLNFLPSKPVILFHCGATVVVAVFEIFSIALIFPFLLNFLRGDESQIPGNHGFASLSFIPWPTALISVIVLFTAKNAMSVWLTNKQLVFSNKLYIELSQNLYSHFYKQNWTSYTHENSSEAFRKIKNTAYEFVVHVLQNLWTMIGDIVILLSMLVVFLWIDYRIIVVLAVVLIPLVLAYHSFKKNVIAKIDTAFRDLTPKANIVLGQGIDSFAEAIVYKKENFFIKRYVEISRITTTLLAKLKIFTAIPPRLFEALGVAGLCSIVVYAKLSGGNTSDHLAVFGLVALTLYRIVPSLTRILTNLSQIQSYSYTITELSENLLAEKSEPQRREQLQFRRSIRIESVDFSYPSGSSQLLININMTVRKGDFVVLQGPSGTGKTTVINILAGLIREYSGNIYIDDTVLTPANVDSWREKIGIVLQAPIVLQSTLLNNIAYGEENNEIDMERVENAVKLSGLREFIESLPNHLKSEIGENGLTLSGGQRQRLVLARALYRDPLVLLMDEVTNQLDETNKISILKNLVQLTKEGKTVIMASHDKAVLDFATRVYSIDRSSIRPVDKRTNASIQN